MSSICGAMRRVPTKPAGAGSLSPDMLANIHSRLDLLDRLAFVAVFRASRHAFKPEAPWLVLPGSTPGTATLFSLADRGAAVGRATGPGHVVLGSSTSSGGGGWLVTADTRGRMDLVNPVTGEQHALPEIATIPCLNRDNPPQGGLTMHADRMRQILFRKVVLSNSSPRPAAMLITGPRFGVAAFAVGDGVWRLATPSRDSVEDAIYYKGQFHSITYSGDVEAWEHDADSGEFNSAVVAPTLLDDADCKYLVAALDGRLMAVLKDSEQTTDTYGQLPRWTCSFKVHVLDGEEWKETDDIGTASLFVGVNSSTCVSTRDHPELRAGCVYYTENEDRRPRPRVDGFQVKNDRRRVGVFSLKDGTVEEVEGLGPYQSWPPPAWFTPSIP